MKIALRSLSLLILAVISTFYAGCKKDDDDSKTVEQQQLEKMVGDWTLVTATDRDGDRTTHFQQTQAPEDLVLTISGNYTGEGGLYAYSLAGKRPTPSPWPESGSWEFGTNKSKDIIRDPDSVDEIAMEYTLSDTNLIITFTLPDNALGWPGNRIKNVIGQWTFTFERP